MVSEFGSVSYISISYHSLPFFDDFFPTVLVVVGRGGEIRTEAVRQYLGHDECVDSRSGAAF